MYVACSTLCFGRYPLEQAFERIAELDFNKVEVAIRSQGPHLTPTEVLADRDHAAARIRMFPGLTPAAFKVEIDTDDAARYEAEFDAVCHLARVSTVATITIPAAPTGTEIGHEIDRLRRLVRIATRQGVVLNVHTRTGTVTESPDAAVELCRQVDGLGLTLDPSHYLCGPNQGKNYDIVFPYVRHVLFRDSGRGPDQLQVRVGQGEIEYSRILMQLARHQYDRLLTVEIVDIPDLPFHMETEVRKLKYLLESLV